MNPKTLFHQSKKQNQMIVYNVLILSKNQQVSIYTVNDFPNGT